MQPTTEIQTASMLPTLGIFPPTQVEYNLCSGKDIVNILNIMLYFNVVKTINNFIYHTLQSNLDNQMDIEMVSFYASDFKRMQVEKTFSQAPTSKNSSTCDHFKVHTFIVKLNY